MRNPDIAGQIVEFNEKLDDSLDDANFKLDPDGPGIEDFHDTSSDPAYGDGSNTPDDSEYDMSRPKPEADDIDNRDPYIGAQIILDDLNPGNLATFKRRFTDVNSFPANGAYMSHFSNKLLWHFSRHS